MSVDCSNYSGRLYDLCTGQGHDGRMDPSKESHERFIENIDRYPTASTKKIPPPVKTKSSSSEKRRPLLGDMIESALSAAGITNERVSRLIGRECGCQKRKESVNKIYEWALKWINGEKTSFDELEGK